MEQLVDQDVWEDAVEGRAVINKQHPHIGVLLLQMAQRSMCCHGNCILCGPVCSISILVGIKGGWQTSFNELRDQSLKALHDDWC